MEIPKSLLFILKYQTAGELCKIRIGYSLERDAMNNSTIASILNSMESDMMVMKKLLCKNDNGEDVYYRFPAVTRKLSVDNFLELTKDVEIPEDLLITYVDNCATVEIVEEPDNHVYFDRNTRRVFIDGNIITDEQVYKLIGVARKNRYFYGYWDYKIYDPCTELDKYPMWQFIDFETPSKIIQNGTTFDDEGFIVVPKYNEEKPTYEIEVGPDVKYIIVDNGDYWDIGVTRPTIDFVQALGDVPACIARTVITYINSHKE